MFQELPSGGKLIQPISTRLWLSIFDLTSPFFFLFFFFNFVSFKFSRFRLNTRTSPPMINHPQSVASSLTSPFLSFFFFLSPSTSPLSLGVSFERLEESLESLPPTLNRNRGATAFFCSFRGGGGVVNEFLACTSRAILIVNRYAHRCTRKHWGKFWCALEKFGKQFGCK